jgi:hypothetical protein
MQQTCRVHAGGHAKAGGRQPIRCQRRQAMILK